MKMTSHFQRFRIWLSSLSFRTGVVVLLLCVVCYILSFAQIALPAEWVDEKEKGMIWFVLFGLAKTFQYTALLILGKAGWQRVKGYINLKKRS